ncbi:MAG: Uncharacterised protein [Flavobacteriia bacterium]|nr:MAG: Uncharacterised protein [Flavobacteriia bacterium]
MNEVAEYLERLRNRLDAGVLLVAVSKRQPIEKLFSAYEAGQRDFGENKVQELVEKQPQMSSDVRWHMIGHLQTNKVKYIAPFIHLIHSVDSLKLLKEVDKRARQNDRVIGVLLQMSIAQESTKTGMDESLLEEILQRSDQGEWPNINIQGLMGMATNTPDEDQIRKEFRDLNRMFQDMRKAGFDLGILSMGMSGDLQIAQEEGSTMVRVGTAAFGPRNY